MSQDTSPKGESRPKGRRGFYLWGVLILVVLAVAGYGIWWWMTPPALPDVAVLEANNPLALGPVRIAVENRAFRQRLRAADRSFPRRQCRACPQA